MANTDEEKGITIIPWFYQLLLPLHKNYSKIVKPMTHLTGNELWKWGMAQQNTFDQLKKQLAEEVVLAILTEGGKFHMEADSSEGGIGAVLSQEQDGK